MNNHAHAGVLAIVVTAIALEAFADMAVMPICCVADFEKLSLVPTGGVTAKLTRVTPAEGGPALRVDFTKTGSERRFIALQAEPKDTLSSFRALDLNYRARIPADMALRFSILALEDDGGAWCRTGRPVRATEDSRGVRVPLQGLRQAAFSDDASGELEWDKVDRLWVGFVADGRGSGSFELRQLVLTSEPYRPSEPVDLFVSAADSWSVSADSAVTRETTTVTVDGQACVKTTFTFPGGRHMYLVPAIKAEELEYSAYAGLRFTYKATVPAGIDGLLVSVHDKGGQFVAKPPPKATGDWVTVMVPWERFVLGSWIRNHDGHLDPDAISQISVGVHGVAAGDGGSGELIVKAIEAVPPTP